MRQITGNKLLVRALKEEGVDTLFGYPGACTIDISDELYKQDEIRVILPRHEQALVHEADAYARTTGKVGVCLVTSGPGATNLVTGLATANYDSVPLVCFTGQVARHLIGNDAFQEVDIVGITRSITKYGVTVRNREDLGRIIKEAFYIARTGRPGPVLVDLPKDVMAELGSAVYPDSVNIRGYKPNTSVHMGQLKRALKMLKKAKKPLFLAGGGVNIARANSIFTEVVEKTQIPVVTTIMGRGAIPTNHPLFIGNLGMHGAYGANMAVSECDLLFSIGTRFNDRITGKLHEFAPNAQIVHIDIDTASISRNIHVDVPIVADAKEAITKMNEYVEKCETKKWLKKIEEWKMEHPLTMKNRQEMGPQDIIEEINRQFDNAIIATDVGQHQMFTTQYIEITNDKQLVTSGGLGTMGYGFPAAIGAALGNPDKKVIAISGDGGMQMNIQEFATAVLEELPLILCVFNNEYLGMVRQWQKLFYGKRYGMTNLKAGALYRRTNGKEMPEYTPDFVKLAESYGAKGIRVTKTEEISAAFEEAKKNAPCIIFIDEVDAIGKSRDSRYGGNDEREQTLNQLLAEMDGFDTSKGLLILAATNRPEVLDPALLRPGRFDRRVIVDRPDLKGRVSILKVHAKNVSLDETVDLEGIALATSGAVGSDLANMMNEAAILAVKNGRSAVSQKDLLEAVEVVLVGKEKKDRILSTEERKIVSYHEVGHALVSALQKDSEPVQKITIVPRTMGALGYVMHVPEEEKFLNTRKELEAMLVGYLGGRAAEEIVFDTVTTGAANDIEQATKVARAMITQYGMSDRFGLMGDRKSVV